MFHPPGLRLAILALTAAAQAFLSPSLFVAILISLTFSHYLMAFYFSRQRLRELLTDSGTYGPLAAIAGAIVLTAWLDAPAMVLVFGLHHVFNEVHLGERRHPAGSLKEKASRYCFETCIYLALVHPDLVRLSRGWLTPSSIGALLACAGVAFAWQTPRFSYDEMLFSAGGAAIAIVCLLSGLGGLDFVLYYHFTYWALAPVHQLSRQGPRAIASYVTATLLPVAAVYVCTPASLHLGGASIETLSRLTRIGGYFHILSSFALSKAHPRFVLRWFDISREPMKETKKKVA